MDDTVGWGGRVMGVWEAFYWWEKGRRGVGVITRAAGGGEGGGGGRRRGWMGRSERLYEGGGYLRVLGGVGEGENEGCVATIMLHLLFSIGAIRLFATLRTVRGGLV